MLLVVRPGAPSSVLAPSSDALALVTKKVQPKNTLLLGSQGEAIIGTMWTLLTSPATPSMPPEACTFPDLSNFMLKGGFCRPATETAQTTLATTAAQSTGALVQNMLRPTLPIDWPEQIHQMIVIELHPAECHPSQRAGNAYHNVSSVSGLCALSQRWSPFP